MDVLPAAGLGERQSLWRGWGCGGQLVSVTAAAVDWATDTGTQALAAPGVYGLLTWPRWPGPQPELGPLVPTQGLFRLSDSGTSSLG